MKGKAEEPAVEHLQLNIDPQELDRESNGLLFVGAGDARELRLEEPWSLVHEVARLEQRLQVNGRQAESCLALDAFYDRGSIAPDEVASELATLLPSRCRPCLTLIPVEPGSLGSRRRVALQAVTAADSVIAGDTARFPASAAAGAVVAVAGQVVPGGDITEQSHRVMQQLQRLLGRHDADLDDAVKFNIFYVGDGTMDDWAVAASVRARYFTAPGPVATGIPVLTLPDDSASIMMQILAIREARAAGLRSHSWPAGHWDWPFRLPYKHGCDVAGTAFVGGQVSLTPEAKVVDAGDWAAQVRRSVANIHRVLDGFGRVGAYKLLRLSAFYSLAEITDRAELARVLADSVDGDVEITLAPMPFLAYQEMAVEIEAQARRR